MYRRHLLRTAFRLSLLGALSSALPGIGASHAASVPIPRSKPRPPQDLPLLVIDAGHGGRDPGAVGRSGTLEKDVVLDIALKLRRRLAGGRELRVQLTRTDDRYLSLDERRDKARAAEANLFLSIHADSAPNREARGLSAYTVSEQGSDEFANRLASRENGADRFGRKPRGDDADVVAFLNDLRVRHTLNAALAVQDRLVAGAGRSMRLLDNPKRSANFAVLRSPDVPSVLIEAGFLSNVEDESLLRRSDYRSRVADILARELSDLARSGLLN